MCYNSGDLQYFKIQPKCSKRLQKVSSHHHLISSIISPSTCFHQAIVKQWHKWWGLFVAPLGGRSVLELSGSQSLRVSLLRSLHVSDGCLSGCFAGLHCSLYDLVVIAVKIQPLGWVALSATCLLLVVCGCSWLLVSWPWYCLAAFGGWLDNFLVDFSDLLLGNQLNSRPLSQRHFVVRLIVGSGS